MAISPVPAQPAAIHYRAQQSVTDLRTGSITLSQGVEAWGPEARLWASWGTYQPSPEALEVGGGVRLVWRGDSAWCSSARVSVQDSSVELTSQVTLFRGGIVVTCRRLTYRLTTRVATLEGPVALRDSAGTWAASGLEAQYAMEGDHFQLAGACTLRAQEAGTPVSVAADTMDSDGSWSSVHARGHVTLQAGEVEGSCLQLWFHRQDQSVVLEGDARLAGRGLRAQAQRVVVYRREGRLSQMVLEGEATVTRTTHDIPDSAQDRATGGRMVVWWAGDEPTRVVVTGQAKAVHRVVDETGRERGFNHVEGDSILMSLRSQSLGDVRVSGNATGTFVPLPEAAQLPGPTLEYGASTLTYDQETRVVTMADRARLTSGTVVLQADTVRYSIPTGHLVAQGNALLKDGTQEVKGHTMTFDTHSRRGVVRAGSTKFEEAFALGRRVARVDARHLNIQGGQFTTCDLSHPHYYVTARRLRATLDDKVVARNVTLWVHDLPVFYFPYWIFPVRRDRHSGFLMPSFSVRNILGLGGSRAGFRGLGYYLVLGDYADAELDLDWTEGLGWTLTGLVSYAWRYRIPYGSLQLAYARRDRRSEWLLRHGHQQFLPRGWRLSSDINATRSKEFLDQETWDPEDRLNTQAGVRSEVALTKTFASLGTSLRLRRAQTWTSSSTPDGPRTVQTVTSALPELAVGVPSRGLIPSPWASRWGQVYAAFNSTFSNRMVESDVPGTREGAATGLVHTAELSWQLPRILRRFTLSPRASLLEAWILRGMPTAGQRITHDRFGVLHGVGASLSTRLYGLWQRPLGPIQALRHVVSPQLSFSSTPDVFSKGWGFETGRFSRGDADPYVASGFGGTYAKSGRLGITLGNVLQAKVRRGDRVVKLDNLANLTFATGYDLQRPEAPWSPLSTSLSLSPGWGISWNVATSHDPNHSWGFVSLTSSLSARVAGAWTRPAMGAPTGTIPSFRGTWSLSASHTYTHGRGYPRDPHALRVDATLAPSRGWEVRVWVNYDVSRGRVMNKSVSLARDLHCWRAEFSWYQAASQWHYLLRAYVKAYPNSLFVKHEERG